MVVFAEWILSVITTIVAAFGVSLSRKAAIGAAAIAAMVVCVGVFSVAISGLLNGIAYSMPDWASAGMALIPGNAPNCLAAYFAARIAKFVYDFNMEAIKTISAIN